MVEELIKLLRNFAVKNYLPLKYLEIVQINLRMEYQILLTKMQRVSAHVVKPVHVHAGILA